MKKECSESCWKLQRKYSASKEKNGNSSMLQNFFSLKLNSKSRKSQVAGKKLKDNIKTRLKGKHFYIRQTKKTQEIKFFMKKNKKF